MSGSGVKYKHSWTELWHKVVSVQQYMHTQLRGSDWPDDCGVELCCVEVDSCEGSLRQAFSKNSNHSTQMPQTYNTTTQHIVYSAVHEISPVASVTIYSNFHNSKYQEQVMQQKTKLKTIKQQQNPFLV